MAFVVTLKDILFGDVPEDGDGFVEYDIHLGIRFLKQKYQIQNRRQGTMLTYTFETLLEIVINKQRNEFGRLLVEVDE
jgi:hypothetical protein